MKKLLISTALAVMTGCASSASQNPQAVTAPLKMTSKGHLYIDMQLNGQQSYPMIIDTAANLGLIPTELLEVLAISDERLTKTQVQGAGAKVELTIAKLANTALGELNVDELDYAVKDMSRLKVEGKMPGIVGHGYLSQFCNIYDFNTSAVTFSAGQCPATAIQSLQSVDFIIEDNFIKVPLNVAGHVVEGLLDTGSPTNYINTHLAQRLALEYGEEDVSRGLNDKATSKRQVTNFTFSMSGQEVANAKSYHADLPVFEVLGYKDKPFVLLGLSNFSDSKLVIDYSSNKIYF